MAKIITIACQKGGAGKTTVTMNLAGELSCRGYRILVVDGDIQGSAGAWATAADERRPFRAPVINLAHQAENIHRAISQHLDAYDIVLVDTPPQDTAPQVPRSLLISDLAVVPISSSWLDLGATTKTLKQIQDIGLTRKDDDALPFRLLLNCSRPNTTVSRKISQFIADQEIPVLKTRLGYLEAFKQAVDNGLAVCDLPGSGEARRQVSELADEVLELLGMKLLADERDCA